MEAQEARKRANSVNDVPFTEIMEAITEAVNSGKYNVWYYKEINNRTRKALRQYGYKVGRTTQDRNEILTEISW